MKKLILLSLLTSIASISYSHGFVVKLGGDYTLYSTPSLEDKVVTNNTAKGKKANAFGGQIEVGYALDYYGKTLGLSIEPGINLGVGYGKYEKGLLLKQEQKFIPGYLGVYIRPSFGVKVNDDFRITMGGYAGAGLFGTYFMETQGIAADKGKFNLTFAFPLGGTVGFEFGNFVLEFNGGIKYTLSKLPDKLEEAIKSTSNSLPDEVKNKLDDAIKSNPLTYNVRVDTNGVTKQNKMIPTFGITFGYKLGR